MSVHDLVFTFQSQDIYTPLSVTPDIPITITITNYGNETLSNLGFFIQPAVNLGSVDNPSQFPPETDYQDLLEWGTSTDLGLTTVGGLKVSLPQNDGSTLISYITRTNGAKLANKIPLTDLSPNQQVEITLILEKPVAVSARRLFIDIVVE